ncbi:MAG TPA: histidine--tRNA ligase [Rhabdochlamydiaceae bacterium]|jgi:histidyl-tRNA synthetase|nr:histidine--tRNA ligase [Rhabdochlamydiaceae bacterium]
MEYTIPKGVFDVLPKEPKPEDAWRASWHWQYVETVLRRCAADYGFKEIRTPLFERTELFVRGVGESSDIVTKEMYTFLDKGERSMTLRPEGTASVMRAFVEKHLDQIPGLHKFFYIGPMFRYERPQSGRYRQHHQFGAEAIGIGKPEQDVELIDLLCEIYRRLGLKGLKVMINSVGDEASRIPYREALKKHLQPHFEKLSADSQVRFTKNILRILDSKDEGDQALLAKAPSILEFLSDEARAHFEKVKRLLEMEKIPYVVNHKLVRGLDYYNKTVFEVASESLGAHNTLGGGGRYDGLIHSFGGPNLPSVGFAAGIERLLQTMTAQHVNFPAPPSPVIFLIPMGEAASEACFALTCRLRRQGIAAEMDLSGKKIQHGLQLAGSENARYSIVIGDREMETGEVEIKEMATRTSQKIVLSKLENFLKG